MLWSLIKIVLFLGSVAALTLGAVYLTESPGGVTISNANTEFNLGPLQAVIAAMALAVAIWLLLKVFSLVVAILKFLNGIHNTDIF